MRHILALALLAALALGCLQQTVGALEPSGTEMKCVGQQGRMPWIAEPGPRPVHSQTNSTDVGMDAAC